MSEKIPQNYLTGDKNVPLSSTLGQAEVLYAASDEVKAMGDSGAL